MDKYNIVYTNAAANDIAEKPWHSKGVRLFITRQDVVVYSTDKTAQTVYIWNVFTAGRDLSSHIEDALEK